MDTADITAGDENPTVTITSDIAFKEDISKDDITFNSGTTGLTLDSVSLAQVTRAVDNKTLVLQFTGTAQAGSLDITVMDSAFAENAGTIDGEINPSIPTIAVGGGSTTEPTTPTTPTTPASPGYTPAPTPSVNPEGELPGADVAPPPEPMPPESSAADGQEVLYVECVDFDLADLYASQNISLGVAVFEDEDFFHVPDNGERVNYAALELGDAVKTSFFNGVFVTSIPKGAGFDEQKKLAASYVSTVFQAFDRDHPEVFWLSGKCREKAIETILGTVTAETPSEIVRQLNRWLTEHNQYNTTPDLTTIDNSHRQRGSICASLR